MKLWFRVVSEVLHACVTLHYGSSRLGSCSITCYPCRTSAFNSEIHDDQQRSQPVYRHTPRRTDTTICKQQHVTGTSADSTTISNHEVTAALNAILAVDKFAASPQMSAFLKYVVEQTLLGNTRRIKAFTVGLEALGKSANFDPQTDPSVRVLAKRLRSSLDTYYLQHPNTPIIIEMKPGSYVPKFVRRTAEQDQQPLNVASNALPASSPMSSPMPTAAQVTSNSTTHLNINKPSKLTEETIRTPAEPANPVTANDAKESREAGIQRLWKAYKSTPKVAMLVASIGISGWLGIASTTPALNAQAAYQAADPTAEMRLELADAGVDQPLIDQLTRVRANAADDVLPVTTIDNQAIRIDDQIALEASADQQPYNYNALNVLSVDDLNLQTEQYKLIVETIPVDQTLHINIQAINPLTGLVAKTQMLIIDQ